MVSVESSKTTDNVEQKRNVSTTKPNKWNDLQQQQQRRQRLSSIDNSNNSKCIISNDDEFNVINVVVCQKQQQSSTISLSIENDSERNKSSLIDKNLKQILYIDTDNNNHKKIGDNNNNLDERKQSSSNGENNSLSFSTTSRSSRSCSTSSNNSLFKSLLLFHSSNNNSSTNNSQKKLTTTGVLDIRPKKRFSFEFPSSTSLFLKKKPLLSSSSSSSTSSSSSKRQQLIPKKGTISQSSQSSAKDSNPSSFIHSTILLKPKKKSIRFNLLQEKEVEKKMASPSLSSGFQTPLPPAMMTPSPLSSQSNHHNQNSSQNISGASNSQALFDEVNYHDGNENDPGKKLQTFKARRKNYRLEKKKLTAELISAIQDPTTIVMSDWLKVRTTLKQWNKYYCELRPGSLYMYKNQKTYKPSNWVGTVMLKMCEVLERPSKKGGFCFKLFHPLDHPIWAPKGPHGEEFTSLLFPLPVSSAIFRAPSEEAGRKWMEAIELSLNCTDLLAPRHIVSPNNANNNENAIADSVIRDQRRDSMPLSPLSSSIISTNSAPESQTLQSFNYINSAEGDLLICSNNINEIDIETHFDIDDDGHTDHGEHDDSIGQHSTEESDDSIFIDDFDVNTGNVGDCHVLANNKLIKQSLSNDHSLKTPIDIPEIDETNYCYDGGNEEFGLVGDAGQTEEVPEENKSLLWTLLKQVRPGMDLSKVVLPTFILEPRSFLEKLTDYYYHCDIISKAALEDDPLMRMKLILKWYLSGFYKKPKGLKKPYNPILGETFRCCWHHPDTDSRTFYIAEQVSHHPPVSAFYVTNRKDGYCISGSILAKSKFYGNSISALLEGTARLTLLARGEDYLITFPFAHCKGIFLGPLAFELGGKVTITCEKTGYKSELEFKLKPFFGSDDQCNLLIGKVRLGNETMASIEGHWDSEIFYKDKRKGVPELFWSGIDPKVKSSRLKRFIVPLDTQHDNESEKLWHKVTLAIQKQDQNMATVEKTNLEEAQRDAARQRSSRLELWQPKYFILDSKFNDWLYRMAELRPWDNRTDVKQYEYDYVIRTLTRHLNPNFIARSSNKTNEQSTDMSINTNVHKHRRFRRQHTCADPTAIDINAANKMAGIQSALDSPQILGSSSSNRILIRNFDTIMQRLSTLQESIERVKEEQSVLRTQFHDLHSAVSIANQLSRSRDKKTLHSDGSSDGPFAITKMQISLLFQSIPSEIRLVIIVLIVHFIVKHLFH